MNYYLGEKVTEIKKSKNIWKVRADLIRSVPQFS